MAVRFLLFGRRTPPSSADSRQAFGGPQGGAEGMRAQTRESIQTIRDKARERLARADQAVRQAGH